jgi:predicted polyphosphate/ATP-dependent NAD kinase
VPQAGARAAAAVRSLLDAWPADRLPPLVLAPPGAMGAAPARDAGAEVTVVGAEPAPDRTTAADTRRAAAALVEGGADLLLVAGGDGTARDVCAAVAEEAIVLGIPAGVKILSGAFATSPAAAGELAAAFLLAARPRTAEAEVVDLDEEAYRRGSVAPRLYGHLRVPRGRRVQGRKSPTPPGAAAAAAAIAAEVAERLDAERAWVLGPGSTVRAIADRLGVAKTLVGVDVVELTGSGARLRVADAAESDLLAVALGGPVTIVLTPIGGQGFLLGRGNQPISPAVLRAAGPGALLVVAAPAKLAELGGRPLLVDTGDPDLDRDLAGHARVITGYHESAVVRIAAA